jgi:hypothetical protein
MFIQVNAVKLIQPSISHLRVFIWDRFSNLFKLIFQLRYLTKNNFKNDMDDNNFIGSIKCQTIVTKIILLI